MKYNKTALCQMMGDKGIFLTTKRHELTRKNFMGNCFDCEDAKFIP